MNIYTLYVGQELIAVIVDDREVVSVNCHIHPLGERRTAFVTPCLGAQKAQQRDA